MENEYWRLLTFQIQTKVCTYVWCACIGWCVAVYVFSVKPLLKSVLIGYMYIYIYIYVYEYSVLILYLIQSDLLLNWPLRTNINEVWTKIRHLIHKQVHLIISVMKWRSIWLALNALTSAVIVSLSFPITALRPSWFVTSRSPISNQRLPSSQGKK